MRVLTLAYHLPLPQLRREMVYTQARVKRRPHLKAFVDSLKTQLDGVTAAIATETALLDAVEYGRAGVDDADEQLDGLFMETTAAAKLAVGGVLTDPLWQSLFGSRRPSEWIKLRLGEELEQVRTWPGKLKGAAAKPLQDLVPRVEALLLLCDAAAKAETDAVTAYETWRLGAKVALIDKANALRKQLAGEAEAHAHSIHADTVRGLGLFRLTPARRTVRQSSVAALQAEIATVKQQLAELEAQLVIAQQQVDAEAQAETERAAAVAKLAELEKARIEAERQISELRSKVGSGKK